MRIRTPSRDAPPSPPPAGGRLRPCRLYRRFWAIAAATLAADQASKLAVEAALPYGSFAEGQAIDIVPGFFRIAHVGNTGAAWSLLSGQSALLAAIAVLALAAIYCFRRALELHRPEVQPPFGLIVGGAVGNLIDRLRHGYVVDFLDFQFGGWHYPTFNIADAGITIGALLYLIRTVFGPKGDERRG